MTAQQSTESTESTESIVIAGAGLAGATAARTLRSEGFAGRITLVGSELHRPYLRPPLSKDYLLGTADEDTVPVAPEAWYAENDVDLLLGQPVAGVDPGTHTVHLSSGETLRYGALLLATGALPRHLQLPGVGLEGVTTFRTLDDSRRLREQISSGGRNLVMIGSGWIGMELAAAATTYGNHVTLIGREAIPLAGAIGPELGAFFRSVHEANGVKFLPGSTAAGLRGDSGRVTAVVTDSGDVLPADVVVIAVGVVPDTALAESAGVALDNGILTDASLRTSAPDVFAAGDVANPLHPFTGQHHRSEHWSNALNGGKTAAKSMLGQDAQLETIPYFYTDQYDVSMEYSGFPTLAAGVEPAIRGSLAGKEFIAFWQHGGRVVAGMNVNVPRSQKAIKALISSRAMIDSGRLTDPAVALDQLLAGD
jgi:NADPH-dependent 2,4-dienoyl-CoA reductase/sulfur reductase-like enzyme